MIILDTNVISEAMRAEPTPAVLSWLDSLDSAEASITSITAAELMLGAATLPTGKRRHELEQTIRRVIDIDFNERVEPIDVAASYEYAQIVAKRKIAGRPISMADAQIAAICVSLGAELATRNTKDFDDLDILLVNPWILED